MYVPMFVWAFPLPSPSSSSPSLSPLLVPLYWFPRFGMPLPGAKEEDTGDGTAGGGGSSPDGLSFHPPPPPATPRLPGYDKYDEYEIRNTLRRYDIHDKRFKYGNMVYSVSCVHTSFSHLGT